MAMIFSILFLLVLPLWTAIAEAATPTTNPISSTIDILTSYTGYDNCTDDYISILKQTVNDAQKVADAGLDDIHDELVSHVYPQRNHQQVDFSKEAAIEFFGPEKENAPEQARIFGKIHASTILSNYAPRWTLFTNLICVVPWADRTPRCDV
jgi:hypothetical protein